MSFLVVIGYRYDRVHTHKIMWPLKMTEELAVSSRFANVPFATILCRFAKKRNERCACTCFAPSAMIKKVRYACTYLVLSTTDQAKAVRELTQLVSETSSQVSEQDVDETTELAYHFG